MSDSIQRTGTAKAPGKRSMRLLLARACGAFRKALPFRRLLADAAGVAAVEFALISPVLFAMLLGMFSFGIAMKNYLIITSAAGQGALTFALSRGTVTPYTTTRTAILAAVPTLTQASITIALTVNAVACTSDATCSTALVAGKSAVVTATYPCTLQVMGINYKPGGCTLTTSTAQMIQ
jgi:Flp pilus assembly protein TadG